MCVDGHECAPPPRKRCALVTLSFPNGLADHGGACLFFRGCPVRRHSDELLPTPWRALVHADGTASARVEYGKFVMDR